MKKTSITAQLLTAVVFSSVVFTACKKEKSANLASAEEQQAANFSSESESENEAVFNDVFDNVVGVNAQVGFGGTGIFGRVANSNGRDANMDSLPSCTRVTFTPNSNSSLFPLRVVIDFGTGCKGNDGRMRYGKIVILYTGRLLEPGNSATTTFDGFKLDSLSVEGTHKITNTTNSTAGNNQRQFTVDVTNAKLTRPSGNYSKWNSQRVITQIEGNGTLIAQDDVFKITGSSNGQVRRGNNLYGWNSEITTPLIKRFTCRWISQGVIKVRRETLASNSQWTAVLDYGAGNCDFYATLTINGTTNQIQLPH